MQCKNKNMRVIRDLSRGLQLYIWVFWFAWFHLIDEIITEYDIVKAINAICIGTSARPNKVVVRVVKQ